MKQDFPEITSSRQTCALTASTISFTICFAVWTIFAIIGVQIKKQLGLSDMQFGLLAGTPILTGSLSRLLLGIWTEQYGGRRVYVAVMLTSAIATFLLAYATTYEMFLLAALGVGIAGGSFAVGIAYVSRWYGRDKQGTALGIFGMGNAGAAITKFCAPFVMIAYGWPVVAQVWAGVMALTAVIFWLTTEDDPVLTERRRTGEKHKPTSAALAPLKNMQVWRFSLYYFFVFGGFVALALWLPHYYVDVYGLDIRTAGMIAATYSLAASVFRAFGGWLSDKYGARTVMYWTLSVSALCTFILSYPPFSLVPFTIIVFVLGFFMALGKAAVYKHVPVYYPDNVGSVGGIVGLIGGLGGFILPIIFGAMTEFTGLRSSVFIILFVIVTASLIWMHLAIRDMDKKGSRSLPALDDMEPSTA